MRKLPHFFLVALLAIGVASSPLSFAKEGKPFITAKDLDLTRLLPPPADRDSPQTKLELAEVLNFQVTRTPDMVARAQADAVENIWRFSDVLGARFNKDKLPKLNAFFIRVLASEGPVTDPAKDFWKRPRPHQYSDLAKPVVKLSSSYSYPSGHATAGTLMGIVLANMVPERRAEIMQRAYEYANNRIVAGIHFRSDVDAGRMAGTLMAATLMTHDDFNAEFDTARSELRAELGLSPLPAVAAAAGR
ncbi:phosphatase PAP2 family protein [Undibacterium sp.]|uniref:acid phosphatase n=1 Tax=Undibacterium sp. TaxID=1914977 RepID=UPI002C921D56|nr:phosphatase PAP2 family protein [Undibacterium sp.]HTD04606.1 phosphatase PAP2 family protein [Undibacterium sp.]